MCNNKKEVELPTRTFWPKDGTKVYLPHDNKVTRTDSASTTTSQNETFPDVKESHESPAVEPVAPPAVEPVEPPAVEPVEPPAVESVEPLAVEPVEPPAVEPAEPPAVEPVEPPAVEPAEPPAVEPAEPPAMESVELPDEESVEPPAVDSVDIIEEDFVFDDDDSSSDSKEDDGLIVDAEFENTSEKNNNSVCYFHYYTTDRKVKINRRTKLNLGAKNKNPLMEIEIFINSVPYAVYYPRHKDFPIVFGCNPKKRNACSGVAIDDTSKRLNDEHVQLAFVNERLVLKSTSGNGDRIKFHTDGEDTSQLLSGEVSIENRNFAFSVGAVKVSVKLFPECGYYLKKTYLLDTQTFAAGGFASTLCVSEKDFICGRSYTPARGETVFPLNLPIGLIAKVENGNLIPAREGIRFTKDGNDFAAVADLTKGNSFNIFNANTNLAKITVLSAFDPEIVFGIVKKSIENEKHDILRSFENLNEVEFYRKNKGKNRNQILEVTVSTGKNVSRSFIEMRNFPVIISNRYDYDRDRSSQIIVSGEEKDFSSRIEIINNRPYFIAERKNNYFPVVVDGMMKTACFNSHKYDITEPLSSFNAGSTNVSVRILPKAAETFFIGKDYLCTVECILTMDERDYVYRDKQNRTLTISKYREIIIHNYTTFGRAPDSDVLLFDGRKEKTVSKNAFHAESDLQGLSLKTEMGDKAFSWFDPTVGGNVLTSEVPLDVGLTVKYKDAYILRITGTVDLIQKCLQSVDN